MHESENPKTPADEQEEFADDHFPEELIEEDDEDVRPKAIKIESMTTMIGRMGVGEKIKLALIGNKEARNLLIKANNKVVVKNVIENPRLTEEEIIMYVSNKNLSAEVPRLIASKKQFLKSFKVRCALVKNPKTPVPYVMKLMPGLPDHELKELARSSGVAGIVKTTARRLLEQRGRV